MRDIRILDACCGSRMLWSDCQINVKEVLKSVPFKPLFGQQRGTTHWMTFMKFEEVIN